MFNVRVLSRGFVYVKIRSGFQLFVLDVLVGNGAEVCLGKSVLTKLIHEVLNEIFYPAPFLQNHFSLAETAFGSVPDEFLERQGDLKRHSQRLSLVWLADRSDVGSDAFKE